MSKPSTLPNLFGLTAREIQILRMVASGLADKAIAEQLGTSAQTVKNHLQATYRKLEARNRTHAVVLALRAGVIRLEDVAP
jgi:DNA-binding NarL/FixJ family response regulator